MARKKTPIELRADQIAKSLVGRRPDLMDFPEAVSHYAKTESEIEFIRDWFATYGGMIDDDGNVSQAAVLLDKLMGRAERARGKLGLDPISAATLIKTRAEVIRLAGGSGDDVVAALTAQGAKALEGKR